MTFRDLSSLSLENLWRTKLRTSLTVLGVMIGIGALVSMVSFGSGIQHNIAREFRELDLFTTIQVLPSELNLEDPLSMDLDAMREASPLDDEVLELIRALPGVMLAYPEISFPALVKLGDAETKTSIRAVPSELGQRKPFSEISFGRFFESDDETSIVVTERLLDDLGIRLTDGAAPSRRARDDTTRQLTMVASGDVIGRTVTIVTSVLDENVLTRAISRTLMPTGRAPFREETVTLDIVGIQSGSMGFSGLGVGGRALIPSGTAERIPRLSFSSIWDLLDSRDGEQEYDSIHVKVGEMGELEAVGDAIEEMGFGTITLADYLDEMKRTFLLMDALLGAVGTVALFVAGLGIVNTMVTSILERTREIGVMKAIGGSESEVRWIFFIEAAIIGSLGGVLGLGLGWAVTRVANVAANAYIRPYGVAPADFFHMPIWLILGAIGFSVVVSLLAGIYPAGRAARVDPVKALRHD